MARLDRSTTMTSLLSRYPGSQRSAIGPKVVAIDKRLMTMLQHLDTATSQQAVADASAFDIQRLYKVRLFL